MRHKLLLHPPVILAAALALAACGEDPEEPDLADLPEADGGAVWTYLQEEAYDGNWSLWPGKTERYESTAPETHGAILTTYVNDRALEAIQSGDDVLPDGAFVVKERWEEDNLAAVTVMYKVDGFNPSAGDWFWLMAEDGMVGAEGAVHMCINCHTAAEDHDYLFLKQQETQ